MGIRGSKVGHSGRVKGAQIAEARGVSESDVRTSIISSICFTILNVYADPSRRPLECGPDDWLLSYYPPSCLYAWRRRLLPGLRVQLQLSSRGGETSCDSPMPCLACPRSLEEGPPWREQRGHCSAGYCGRRLLEPS